MIYTIRTFHVHRKDYAEFVRFSEEQIWPAIEEKGARALGLWVVAIGGPERIFLMTRYDSHGHWEETRNWDNLANEGSGRAALVHETECISLLPLTQRQPDSDAPEKSLAFILCAHSKSRPPTFRVLSTYQKISGGPGSPEAKVCAPLANG